MSEQHWILIGFGSMILAIICFIFMLFILGSNNKNFTIGQLFQLISESTSIKKIVYLSIIILQFTFIFGIFIAFTKAIPSIEEEHCRIKKEFFNAEYNALITDKFIDKSNHATPTLFLKSNTKTEKFYGNAFFNDIYNYAEPGDSIHKNKSTFNILITKDSNKKYIKIDIPCNDINAL